VFFLPYLLSKAEAPQQLITYRLLLPLSKSCCYSSGGSIAPLLDKKVQTIQVSKFHLEP